MSIYTIVLFFHVSAALGYFIGNGVWLVGLSALRRAQRVEQVRTLLGLVGRVVPLFGISLLLLLATGIYMTATTWGFQTGWIDVALTSLLLLFLLATVLIDPRRRALLRLVREAPDGSLPQSLEQRIHDPILSTSLQTVAAVLLGIVFLMTNKPALLISLIVMVVALALGVASGMFVLRSRRTQVHEAAPQANRIKEPIA